MNFVLLRYVEIVYIIQIRNLINKVFLYLYIILNPVIFYIPFAQFFYIINTKKDLKNKIPKKFEQWMSLIFYYFFCMLFLKKIRTCFIFKRSYFYIFTIFFRSLIATLHNFRYNKQEGIFHLI